MKILKIAVIAVVALFVIPMIISIFMATDSTGSSPELDKIPDHITTAAETRYKDALRCDSLNDMKCVSERLNTLITSNAESPYADSARMLLAELKPKIDADSLDRAKKNKVLKAKYASMFRVEKDDFKGTSFYYHKKSPTYSDRTAMIVYLGKNGTSIYPRLKIQYGSDDWLFMHQWILKSDDQTFTITAESYDVKRDNNGGRIWEWYDINPDNSQLAFIKRMANAETAKIRFEGTDYYHDYTLTANNRLALKETIAAYEAFLINPELAP